MDALGTIQKKLFLCVGDGNHQKVARRIFRIGAKTSMCHLLQHLQHHHRCQCRFLIQHLFLRLPLCQIVQVVLWMHVLNCAQHHLMQSTQHASQIVVTNAVGHQLLSPLRSQRQLQCRVPVAATTPPERARVSVLLAKAPVNPYDLPLVISVGLWIQRWEPLASTTVAMIVGSVGESL